VLRLSGEDGSFFEMDIAGYQYPADVCSPLPEYDLNWLQVHIHARDADDHEWEATDPCLLTWELVELARWLESYPKDSTTPSTMQFTEPCLSFDLHRMPCESPAGKEGCSVVLLVQLDCEMGQLPTQRSQEHSEAILRFQLTTKELSRATRDCSDLACTFRRREGHAGFARDTVD
jgi:hypothetical protein